MDTYTLCLIGCHDVTNLDVNLTHAEAELLQRISAQIALIVESECQPSMELIKKPTA